MSETESLCPACRTPLQRVKAAIGIRFQCPTCQGVIITLAIFRRLLIEGVGSQVWVASGGQPADGHPCGFCTRSMRPTAVPGVPGEPADGAHVSRVEVCRVCEAVWVPSDQAALLPMLPTTARAPLSQPTPPTRCPECGAPFEVGADGCCPYCHRVVEHQPEVIMVHDGSGPGTAWPGGGVERTAVGVAASIALGVLFGR